MASVNLVWFRNDLRIDDNSALQEAIASGLPIIPIYIVDENAAGEWCMGAASRWWLHHALHSLEERLQKYSGKLFYFHASAEAVMLALCQTIEVAGVYFNTSNEAWALAQQRSVQNVLTQQGIENFIFRSNELIDPELLLNKQGGPYKVFSPFWREACARGFPSAQRTAIEKAPWFVSQIKNEKKLGDLALLPPKKWHQGFYKHWQPDEKGLKQALNNIKFKLHDYAHARDFPAQASTSRLSPYLAFGQVSPARVLSYIDNCEGGKKFLAELGWREFSRYLQYHFPHTSNLPLDSRYEYFPWQNDQQLVKLWQQGLTGVPIVDAGMRELWQTGWMHNRVRMIVASFLVKHLQTHWLHGARWFWDTLVDADLANNTQGWQWVAGCGADAAPFFRVFNPVIQSRKFDSQGEYLRMWLPELAKLPNKYIHAPWEAETEMLAECEVVLGENYPQPIIDLQAGRESVLKLHQNFLER